MLVFPPGHDHFIADIVEDLAAIVYDGKGKKAKRSVEQSVDAHAAKPLGQPRRSQVVDEKHGARNADRGVSIDR